MTQENRTTIWNRTPRGQEYQKQWRADNKERIARTSQNISQYTPEYKDHHREEIKKYRQQAREFNNEIKMHYSCCNPFCFGPHLPEHSHFHHIDPASKVFNIGQAFSTSKKVKTKTILEMNKCIVLCNKCHQAYHSGRINLNILKRCNIDKDGKPINIPYKIQFAYDERMGEIMGGNLHYYPYQ